MQRRIAGWLTGAALVGILAIVGLTFQKTSRNQAGLADLAKCLTQKGWKMYGAWWCPHCNEQKKMFGKAFQYINYKECYKKGSKREQTKTCKEKNIHTYPTWEDPEGEYYKSTYFPEQLARMSGCPYNPPE